MSTPSSPNSWTATIIQPRNSSDLRYLFRSPDGKLIFDQQLVGKLFNIVNDHLDIDGAAPPDASALENARAFVQVQLGDNLYIVSYQRSDGTPQMPEELQESWHALQKPNGDWCFVPKSQETVPEDWPPKGLFNKAQAPPALTTAEPEEETEELKQAKQVANPNALNTNSSDHRNCGNSGDGACTEVSRTAASRSGNSPNSPISDDESHPKPPAKHPPSDVLDFLESTIAQYLVCSPAQRSVLALWILHTYTFQAAHFTPYLNIYSPLEESGKSTCMAILRSFCASPWWASGVSPAIFKKRISVGHPTVLLDNWQTIFRGSDKNQFTGFLLNGCDQARDVASFDHLSETSTANLWQTFCPKAFAGLESLPPSLARHSIPIVLRRRKPLQTVKSSFNLLVPGSTSKLTSWMQRWATDHEERVATTFDGYELEGPMLPGLSPHQQNCAKALISLAEAIGGHWPQKARDALMEIFDDYNKSQSSPTQLLYDIRDAFARHGNPQRIFTAELLDDLHDLDDRTWHEYGKSGKPLTPQALSRILGPCFNIYSRSQRRGKEKLRGYQLSDFQEAWEQYLPPPGQDQPIPTKDKPTTSTEPTSSTKSMPSTKSTPSSSEESRQAKTTSKPPKSSLVSMSHSKASAQKIGPNPGSRLKHFVAKTMRIFTAIWP